MLRARSVIAQSSRRSGVGGLRPSLRATAAASATIRARKGSPGAGGRPADAALGA